MARIAIFVLIAAFSSVSADQKIILSNGVKLKVEDSGILTINPEEKIPFSNLTSTVTFEELNEVDSAGNVVEQTHSLRNFFNATLFKIGDQTDVLFQNISAICFDLTFKIEMKNRTTTLVLQIYIFKENGSFIWGDEEVVVEKGTVKFNFIVKDWGFCGYQEACPDKEGKNQTGSYLDTTFCVQAATSGTLVNYPAGEKGPKGKNKATRYNFGNIMMDIPYWVKNDDMDEKITAPTVDIKAGKTCLKVRLPRFTKTVIFDPSFTVDRAYVPPTTKAPSPSCAACLKWSLAFVLIYLVATWLK